MLARISQLIAENTGIDPAEIKPETHILRDLEINSIDIVNLVCIFEEEFGIEIPDRQIKDFVTVQDFADYIIRALKETA
jgi:acyl carrier protein